MDSLDEDSHKIFKYLQAANSSSNKKQEFSLSNTLIKQKNDNHNN